MIKSKRLRWEGQVARMKGGRSAFKILTGSAKGMRPLGISRRRWKDNIRMDLKEIGINKRNWVDSAQDGESPCECGIDPPGSINHGVMRNVTLSSQKDSSLKIINFPVEQFLNRF